MSMAFSVQDLDYLTALGPAALNDGPVVALEQAWRDCLAGQVERPAGVRQVIWDSWRRSVQAGIDPADNAYRFVADDTLAAAQAAHRVLIEAAAQVMHGLLAYNPRGHINLTDADGTTLYFCGLDITPVGSRLLESVQGTNCTGLALAWRWPRIAWCTCWPRKTSASACASAACIAPPRQSRMPRARPWPC